MKKWNRILIGLVVLVTLKMIFIGFNNDEGYGIVLGYRMAIGDRLVTQMWEPHQTSAIFSYVLVKLYWLFTGGSNTGIVLFMHIVGAGIQLLVSWFLYRVVQNWVDKKWALFIACFYALSYPKGIISPEYSNLQNWFTMCTVLFFVLSMEYKQKQCKGKTVGCLFLSGCSLTGAIFAYPSMIILYSTLLILVILEYRKSKEQGERKKSTLFWQIIGISIPVIIAGIVFFIKILGYCDWNTLWWNIGHILNDGSHSEGLWSKCIDTLIGLGEVLLIAGTYYGASFCIAFCFLRKKVNKRQLQSIIIIISLVISFVVQIIIWLVKDNFVNEPMIEVIIMTVTGVILLRRGEKEKYFLVFSLAGFVASLILSNFKAKELVPYLNIAAIGGVLLFIREIQEFFSGEIKTKTLKTFQTVVLVWLCTIAFGHIWVTHQGGEIHVPLTETRNICKTGPCMGILTNYMTGYRYNEIADEWDKMIQNGDSVLYVGPSSIYYLMGNEKISASNTISTPTYDQTLLEYWEKNPEKYPDVVMVESCYGVLSYPEDSFIIQWLNNVYRASNMKDYEYVRVYFKNK